MPPSILDSREFDESLFWPRDDHSDTPPGATELAIAVDGAELHARWHQHTANAPVTRATVVVFHGNGEIVSDYDDFAPRYRAFGADLVAVDFRGYGRSTGTPRYRDCIRDAVPALRAILGRSPTRPIVVLGRSLGGACAAEIAGLDGAAGRSVPLVDGIVLESAASNIRGLIERRGLPAPPQFTPEETAFFDPAPKLARCKLPALVLHGEQDTLIRLREAHENLAALGSADDDKSLVVIPKAGHNDLMANPLYWSALGGFLDKLAAVRR